MTQFSEDSVFMEQRAGELGNQADEYDRIRTQLKNVATTMHGYESKDYKAFEASITNLCEELKVVVERLRNAEVTIRSQASHYDQREADNTQRASRLPQ